MDILLSLPPSFRYSIDPPSNAPQHPTSTLCSFAMIDNQFVFKQYGSDGFLPYFELPKGHIAEIAQVDYYAPFYTYSFRLKSGLVFTAVTNIQLPPYYFLTPRALFAQNQCEEYHFDIVSYFKQMGLEFSAHEAAIQFSPNARDKYDALLGVSDFDKPTELRSLRFVKETSYGFRISCLNEDFGLCATYPQFLVFPAALSDENIRNCAKFRSNNRLPTLSLRCANASVFRAGQPNFGYFNSNREYMGDDQDIIAGIGQQVVILDCRPFLNAFANKFYGKGMEQHRKYENIIRITFLGLENIHFLRKAWQQLSDVFKPLSSVSTTYIYQLPQDTPCIITAEQCTVPESLNRAESLEAILPRIDRSDWQGQLQLLVQSADECRKLLTSGVSVLLHCSDGWDRTAQMSALVGVLVFPHFRTLRGFLDLIYREFLDFGHKIGSRSGNLLYKQEIEREISPVFLLFLDAVRQIRQWNRSYFGFGENLLLFLAFHVRSLVFTGFYCDCARDRIRSREKMGIFGYILQHIQDYQIDDADINVEPQIPNYKTSVWWRYWNGGGW